MGASAARKQTGFRILGISEVSVMQAGGLAGKTLLVSMVLGTLAIAADPCGIVPIPFENNTALSAKLINQSFPLNYYAGPSYTCKKVLNMQAGIEGIEVLGQYDEWYALRIPSKSIGLAWLKKTELLLDEIGVAGPVSESDISDKANIESSGEEAVKSITTQKDEASVEDLVIPTKSIGKDNLTEVPSIVRKEGAGQIEENKKSEDYQGKALRERAKNLYLARFGEQIQEQAWQHLPSSDSIYKELNVLLRIRLGSAGMVKSVEVEQTSGNAEFDQSAIEAIWKTSPLPGLEKSHVRVEIGPLSNREIAQEELERVKEKGLDPFIHQDPENDGKFYVALGYFADPSLASDFLEELTGLGVGANAFSFGDVSEFSFRLFEKKVVWRVLQDTNLQVEPDPFADSVSGLSVGKKVIVVNEDGLWAKVKFDGKEGYIFREYLALAEEQKSNEERTEGQAKKDERYSKLNKNPARSDIGRYVVEVHFTKYNGVYQYGIREPNDPTPRPISENQLKNELDRLKETHRDKLYTRVMFPNSSGLSHDEAWKFTSAILNKYDYYYDQHSQMEEEKKRLAEEKERKEEPAEKEQMEKEKKQKEEAERKKIEEAKRKKWVEAERKKKEEAEREQKVEEAKQKRESGLGLQERLEQEQLQGDALRALGEFDWRIREAIERNWVRPASCQSGQSAKILIRVTSNGDVMEAKVTKSSGDPYFDFSAERAVLKASPLPLPEDQRYREIYSKERIQLYFAPDD